MLFNHYTTELRTFFENLPVNVDSTLPHATVIENGREKLFDFSYPIFDETYRKVFETHFIRKFYMRQIGFESFGLFKFQLETWLVINMPYFNKIFESELIQYDPLSNVKVDTKSTKKVDKNQNDTRNKNDTKSTTADRSMDVKNISNRVDNQKNSMTGSSNATQTKHESGTVSDDNFARQLESNNPDSRLTITTNDGQGVIEYASKITEDNENNTKTTTVDGTNTNNETSQVDSTNATTSTLNDTVNTSDNTTMKTNDSTTDTLVSAINDVEDYVSNRVGKIGDDSFSKMLHEYRKVLLRVENQIFDEMNQLFMMVY